MITERHNIACTLIMRAIEAGSFVPVYNGSKDRLALQSLQISDGSTHRTITERLPSSRLTTKLRRTANCPDALLVTEPSKRKMHLMPTLDMHKNSGAG